VHPLFKDHFRMRIFPAGSRELTHSCRRLVAACPNSIRSAIFLVLLIASTYPGPTRAQNNVLTQHNDIGRTGANTNETILTPSNVNATTFGKLFSHTVDGYVYAQPLYVSGLTMGSGTAQSGTTHNVFFIATENDSVYAFDADDNGGGNASPLWQVSMIDSAHGAGSGENPVDYHDVSIGDIVPIIGITSTPVIDLSTNTMYVVAKSTVADTTFIQRLHALDITTGQEKFGGPATLSASVPGTGTGSSGGTLNWDPKWQNNRASLLLLNGIVYIAFGSHGDNGPWHGWIMAYNATSLRQTGVFCTSPNGQGSGVWMGGSGLAADVPDPANHPYGRMFVPTGNGTYDATTPYTAQMDYGDDHLRLDLTNGAITVQDAFTPSNQAALNGADEDVASGGIVLLPDQTVGGHTRLLAQVGKEGKIYLIDRDSMGGYDTSGDHAVQEISGQTGGVWGMPAYWNNNLYFWGRNFTLTAFSLSAGKISNTPTSQAADSILFPSATPSVSSSGNSNGIVWALQADAAPQSGQAVLRAYDATDVSNEIYNSAQNSTRDAAGQAVKFSVPTITNGRVYVGAARSVSVFGLLAGSPPAATPAISPASQTFSGTVLVTITDSTSGASIYYTTDGSTPTASSLIYTGPISVNTTQTISAVASAAGFVTSAVAQQTYALQTQTLMPTFAPPAGSYTTAQTVAISDATPNSKIYFTTDGTTPIPGAGSTQLYTAPISVGATTTINAIASATGFSSSPEASSTYTITLGTTGINFSTGFSAAASAMTFNGNTTLDDTRLQLTSGVANQTSSAFYNTPLNIQTFTTDFTMQLSNPAAEGCTFTIQGNGPTALGPGGGGLGYGPSAPTNPPSPNAPFGNSVAVKFDFFSNVGEGPNSTGLYTNGASPTTPAIDLTPSGIDLHSGDTMSVHLQYDGTTLSMIISDAIANKTFTNSWPVDIPSLVGGGTAYVGFTAATGGQSSSQKIESWTFTSTVITPPSGTYTLPVTVTLKDATPNATIYYTTDGTTPTTSSTPYAGPFQLSGPTTVRAFAMANASAASGIASNNYAIQAATPVFSPAPGTYASSQEVTITDPTPGSVIYYTTDGSDPTTASTQYVSVISVATSETLKAIAVVAGYTNSVVATGAYVITPTAPPAPPPTPSDFTLTVGSTTLTVAQGGQGSDAVTIAPQNGGFSNAVQLTCTVTGPAPLATCSLSPASVTPGAQPATTTLTIVAPSMTAMLTPPIDPNVGPHAGPKIWSQAKPSANRPLDRALLDAGRFRFTIFNATLMALLWMGLAVLVIRKTELIPASRLGVARKYAWIAAIVFIGLGLTSCGGGGTGATAPQASSSPKMYIVTVTAASSTAASNTIQHTVQLTVTVP
jgi:hypothetical protein